MDKFQRYLPTDKHDFDSVEKLKQLDRESLIPLLPFLMEWMQDINWPITKEIAKILITFPEEIVPQVKYVLSTDDDCWVYWTLLYLVKEMPSEIKKLFVKELNEIIEFKFQYEEVENVREAAQEILDEIDSKN